MAHSKDFELALRVRAEMKDAVKRLNGLERELYQAGDAADRADKQTSAFSRAVDKMGDKAKSSGLHLNKLALAAGAAFAVAGVSRFVHYLVQSNEQLYQMSQQAKGLNVSVKFLAGMEQQADDLGVGLNNLSVVFGTLNRQLAGAKNGSATSQNYLASFGVDYRRVSSTSEAFLQIADNVKQYGLNAQRSGQLLTLLSASGKQIVPILEQGGDAIRAQNDAMAETGQIITDQSLPQIVALHNATDAIGDSFTALRNNLIIELAPALVQTAGTFESMMEAFAEELNDPQVQQGIQSFVEGLGEIVTWSVKVAAKIGAALDGIKEFSEYLASQDTGFVSGTIAEQQTRQATALKQRAVMVSGYNRDANSLHLGFVPGIQHNGQDALDYVDTIARRSANAKIDTSLSQAEQQRQFEILAALKRSNDAFVKTYADSSDTLIQKMVTTTRAANMVLAKTLSSAQDRNKRVQILQGSGALDVGSGLTGQPGKPSPSTTPPSDKAAEAAARARAAATANKQLRDTFIALQAAQDPVAAAWVKYNDVVAKATAAANKAKQATGANTESIDGQLAAIKHLAAGARDAKIAEIAEIAEKDSKAWEQFRASLQTPIEARVNDAVAAIDMLNKHMAKGKLTAAQYQGLVSKVFAKAVGVGPLRRVHTPGAGGQIIDQQSQEQSDFAHQMQLAQQVRDAILANDTATYDQRIAAQRAYQQQADQLARIHAQNQVAIAQQKNQFALSTAQQGFSALANAMANAHGAQSKQARAAFALQKAAAVASAVLSISQSIANSAKIGYPWNIVAIAGAVAQGAALVANIRSVQPGYADGGYTGAGGKHQVAGVVHAGEVVWSQDDIARAGGVGMVEAWRRGLPGYAAGGVVNPLANAPSPAELGFQPPAVPKVSMPTPDDGGGQRGGQKVGVRIINAVDPSFVTDNMASPEGEEVIINTIAQNQARVKQLVG